MLRAAERAFLFYWTGKNGVMTVVYEHIVIKRDHAIIT